MQEDASGRPLTEEPVAPEASADASGSEEKEPWLSASRLPRIAGLTVLVVALLALVAFYGGRFWLRASARKKPAAAGWIPDRAGIEGAGDGRAGTRTGCRTSLPVRSMTWCLRKDM